MLVECRKCGKEGQAEHEDENSRIVVNLDSVLETSRLRVQSSTQNVPRCSYCKSKDLKFISSF